MIYLSALVRTIIGLIFGLLCSLALSPALAAFTTADGQPPGWTTLAIIVVCTALGFFAPTIRRALGRGFVLLGAAFFVLPISTLLLAGRVTGDMVGNAAPGSEAGTALGAGIAGVFMTGASAFFGFIIGTVLLVIGLILGLGGRREVVVVDDRRVRVDPR